MNDHGSRQVATVVTPQNSIERFKLEVTQHLIEAENILARKHFFNVQLEAELYTDNHGNRTAHVFAKERRIVNGRLTDFERIELDAYRAEGTYVAFNGGHRTHAPEDTASSLASTIRHMREVKAKAPTK
ncbi:hypothetical protein SEA_DANIELLEIGNACE_43 [Arthrobacter phage DanielleIgnace]|nr:hypothetical protein SEA_DANIELLEIGNACE_43 [Arthrobacter phage DanielleIgnace]